jgi:hypothetical protein
MFHMFLAVVWILHSRVKASLREKTSFISKTHVSHVSVCSLDLRFWGLHDSKRKKSLISNTDVSCISVCHLDLTF